MSHDGFNKIVPMPACNTWFVSFYACKSQAIRSSSFAKRTTSKQQLDSPWQRGYSIGQPQSPAPPGSAGKKAAKQPPQRLWAFGGNVTGCQGHCRWILKRGGWPTWSGWMHPVEQMMNLSMNLFLAKRKIQILPEKSTIPFWFERSTWNFPFQRLTWAIFTWRTLTSSYQKLDPNRNQSTQIDSYPLHLCTYSFSSFHQYTSCPLKFSDLSYPLASMYGIFTVPTFTYI